MFTNDTKELVASYGQPHRLVLKGHSIKNGLEKKCYPPALKITFIRLTVSCQRRLETTRYLSINKGYITIRLEKRKQPQKRSTVDKP